MTNLNISFGSIDQRESGRSSKSSNLNYEQGLKKKEF
jgi:hypothetical protein